MEVFGGGDVEVGCGLGDGFLGEEFLQVQDFGFLDLHFVDVVDVRETY